LRKAGILILASSAAIAVGTSAVGYGVTVRNAPIPSGGTARAAQAAARAVPSGAVAAASPARTALQPRSPGAFIEPDADFQFPRLAEYPGPAGRIGIAFAGEPFRTRGHPFFRAGPNGRACVTCHQPADAMSLSTRTIKARWDATGGRDPLFQVSDGANCPNLPRGEQKSHSLLLERGVFRVSLPWPPKRPDGTQIDPDFTLEVVADPTGCNTSPVYGLKSPIPMVSVYRRPRMAGNLRYVEKSGQSLNFKSMTPLERDPVSGEHSSMAIMSDARATSLRAQAVEAAGVHMGLSNFTPQELERLVDFERKLHVAQNASTIGGRFDAPNTPKALGVNAMVKGTAQYIGNDRNTGVFFFFNEWKKPVRPGDAQGEFRASVARGYDVFFLKPIWISDTYGINHLPLAGNPYKQTCAFCHSTQLTGGDDVPGWMDIGTNNFPNTAASPDLPTFKLTCKDTTAPHPFMGRVIFTHDPGRALVSGKCQDAGGVVMQQFRGISARAPYFTNGGAKSLREVVDFYDRRYRIGYSDQEKQDLINFLSVL